jgi:hypothetical protein
VFAASYKQYLYIEKHISPQNMQWKHIGVSCEVQTTSTYKKGRLSPYQVVEGSMVVRY